MKSWKRKLLSALCTATLTLSLTPAVLATNTVQNALSNESAVTTFSDVSEGQWFKSFVDKAVSASLMSGMGGDNFGPGENLTLAQSMVLAYQIHSQANGGVLPTAEGPWYVAYYQYCLDNHLITTDQFFPDDLNRTATRFDMVSVLDKAAPASRMEPIKSVSDGTIPDLREHELYGDVVYKWYRAGVVAGDAQGRFNGHSNITRAEVAVILCQLNRLVEPSNVETPAVKPEKPEVKPEKPEVDPDIEPEKPATSHTIYITPTGKRYHYDSSCNGGTYIKSTLDEALRRGLTPCKKCVE